MPMNEWVTLPEAMISSAIFRAEFTGIANPSPMLPPVSPVDAPAVGIPTRAPEQFTSAPPLLPGLIDASV